MADTSLTFDRLPIRSVRFAATHKDMLLFFVLAVSCDAASTVHFMQYIGPDAESHLMVRFAAQTLGIYWGPLMTIPGKLLGALFLGATLGDRARWALLIAGAISIWAAWYNVWGMYILWSPHY